MADRSGVTLFDLEEGDLFAFGYDLATTYRLVGWDERNNALVRAQRAMAPDETANPYYGNIVRR